MATARTPPPGGSPLWALVLAGGDGTRLRELVVDTYGYPRPKQFCALVGRRTLVEQTIARAELLVPRERVVVSTTARWRTETCQCLARVPGVNLLEQPRNAGTTPALLTALLEIYVRDPDARVAVLPSDHYVSDDASFMATVARAAAPSAPPIVLLGAHLPAPEEGLGWMVPAFSGGDFLPVGRFVEKPSLERAADLLRTGALANTFTMVVRARVLLELIGRCCPGWFRAATDALGDDDELREIYDRLPASDLSNEVLQRAVDDLYALPLAPELEWSDVGTPQRLERVLRSLEGRRAPAPTESPAPGP